MPNGFSASINGLEEQASSSIPSQVNIIHSAPSVDTTMQPALVIVGSRDRTHNRKGSRTNLITD